MRPSKNFTNKKSSTCESNDLTLIEDARRMDHSDDGALDNILNDINSVRNKGQNEQTALFNVPMGHYVFANSLTAAEPDYAK